jgi:3-hydroxyacyl-CoA dehydrogenase/enoyl-CoA hydratase/3-hydroxybutyryl-CoA epimerase
VSLEEAARVTGRGVPPAWQRALLQGNPLGRSVILSRARTAVLAETKGRYPAPLRILEVLARGLGGPVAESLRLEAEAAGDLLVTPECRNLAALFFLTERAKREPAADRARPVARVAVLGAGVMGGGIAALFVRSGLRVRLKDVAHEAIGRALATAWDLFERERRRRRIDSQERERRMHRVSGTLDYSGFRRVDLVVEAIVEDLLIKRRVLAEVEQVVPEHAVLATNTSSLRLEDLAQGLVKPERLVGLHFFNPVHRMPLVEVVVGEQTSVEARDTALAMARTAGKTPVVVRSSPGFLVNRILMRYAEEALRLFEAGVPIEQLDQAMVDFGMPMGPLTLLDEIGLDVALKVATVFEQAFAGEVDRPQVLRPMVEGGRLGKKNGLGFYRHSRERREPDPAVYTLVTRPSGSTVQSGGEAWVERMVLAMVNEAGRCLDENVVAGAGDVDLAMILGTGFPPFRGGLLRYADSLGLERVVGRLQALSEVYGPRFAPARFLRERAGSGRWLRSDVPA